jgi:hypothetical protein
VWESFAAATDADRLRGKRDVLPTIECLRGSERGDGTSSAIAAAIVKRIFDPSEIFLIRQKSDSGVARCSDVRVTAPI